MNEINFRFPNSSSLAIFSQPLSSKSISFEKSPLTFSEKILQQVTEHWILQLRQKQYQLSKKGIPAKIKSYSSFHDHNLDALFVNEKPVMWPGSCVTLRDWHVNNGSAILFVSELSYPFIAALSDENFLNKLHDENFHSLRPPLAVCTFAITSDSFLVLTVRGIATPVYPGRFYGQGGNPQHSQIDLLQHQLEEMEEELLIKPDEVMHDSLKFFGIVEDQENFPRKPDLIGTVKISLSSHELKDRFESRLHNNRPPDVADTRLIHFDDENLFDFLKSETPKNFCPPAHGGLLLVGMREFGVDWLNRITNND